VRAAQENIVDRVAHLEKSALGCLVEFCSRGSAKELDGLIASGLAADQFSTSDHRAIFRAMVEIRDKGKIPDEPSLIGKLDGRLMAQVCDLTKGVVPENLKGNVHDLREVWRDRYFSKQIEELASLTTPDDQLALVERMRETLLGSGDADSWRSIFHTSEEFENAPPLGFAIDGFLQEAGVTLIGGLAGHGKTLLMLSMVRALLQESALFGYEMFSVSRRAERVIYLIPESSIGPFWSRIKMFGLEQFVREDRLLIRTIQAREQVDLTDPRMLAAVEGADVFLDSVVRFTVGSENDAENARLFSDVLFRLLRSGARSITGCHHSPKSFEGAQRMSLENVLRGSGDLGALTTTCWGTRQIDAARNRIYVENVKARDFEPCRSFILEGRPHLDETGQFAMHAKPGEAEELRSYLQQKGGRPLAPNRAEQIAMAAFLRAKGDSIREIASKMKVSKTTAARMLDDYDLSDHNSEEEGRKPQ
jgi:AAA domain